MTAETPERIQVHCSKDVADYMRDVLTDLDHEEFWIILMNRANRIIGRIRLSSGGTAGTVTDVKMIMKKSIEKLAQALIVCHNHPSGNTKPSESDTKITIKIKEAANLLDIQLMDHIIITDKDYYSFCDEGVI
jgi:DNA repair protein RadC